MAHNAEAQNDLCDFLDDGGLILTGRGNLIAMTKLRELFEHGFLLVWWADVDESLQETQQLSHVRFEFLLVLLVIYVRFVNIQLIVEA